MPFNKEMQRALEADGKKLRQLTGEDHGPWPRRANMSTWGDKPNDPQCSNPNIPLLERLRHFGANGMGDVSGIVAQTPQAVGLWRRHLHGDSPMRREVNV